MTFGVMLHLADRPACASGLPVSIGPSTDGRVSLRASVTVGSSSKRPPGVIPLRPVIVSNWQTRQSRRESMRAERIL